LFDHITIRVSRREESERFYDTVLSPLGIARTQDGEVFAEWGEFSLASETEEKPPTRNLHVAFTASTRDLVDAFWRAGIHANYRDDGAPGERPQYSPTYYGGFLRDPDGNSAEAVHHAAAEGRGQIDHLWIRVANLEAAKTFYQAVAPYTGFELHRESQVRAQFAGPAASFSVVAGAPTLNAHIAFPARDDATVDAFHAAALAAGYRDDGGPGERLAYHPGYYGAFVLDPDGNSVEVVNHNRE
jgi:catechol 2,3-dioxygenase-like lactoylglutathione lyase family enzyme